MPDLPEWLGDPGGLTPHGFCLQWQPGLLWFVAGADAVVAVAYYFIPLTLFWFTRRRRGSQFHLIALLFAAFIMACGTIHFWDVLTLWFPAC